MVIGLNKDLKELLGYAYKNVSKIAKETKKLWSLPQSEVFIYFGESGDFVITYMDRRSYPDGRAYITFPPMQTKKMILSELDEIAYKINYNKNFIGSIQNNCLD